MNDSYSRHIAHLQEQYELALARLDNVDGVLLHSGRERYYFADDQAPPFRAFGHFSHWLPVNRPEQVLLIVPGQRPVYFQVIPRDFWYDQSIDNAAWWANEFDIVPLSSSALIQAQLDKGHGKAGAEANPAGRRHRYAFLGEAEDFAATLGIEKARINPPDLLHSLDFIRACKTDYETEQIRAANQLALKGHAAARTEFLAGGSEYAIHMAYLQACQATDQDCPYTSIVALNEKAAILHYQYKRQVLPSGQKSQVLLIDAGCRINNYCSDITRTTTAPDCHATFRDLLHGMDSLQQRLVQEVKPGKPYLQLHQSAMQQITELAVELDILTCGVEEAASLQLHNLFMPHGVGHLLGVQVHDVGGHLAGADGRMLKPPPEFPSLRNTRTMTANMVFTVEPGFYFIPQLLDGMRNTGPGRNLNWSLIDELLPLGGIRIEDNVRVTADGVENLTRSQRD